MTNRAVRIVTARPWLTAAVVVAVVAAGTAIYFTTRGHPVAQPEVTSRLVSVSRGTVRAEVSATGTISPADEKDVSFGSSGQVTSVRVATGDKVHEGQILGTIDRLSLRAALATDRAALASAKAQLAAAKDDSSATAAQLSADRVSVKTARASVQAAEKALRNARLRSPISGTVAAVNVAKGDQTGSSTGNGSSPNADASSNSSSDQSSSDADFIVIGGKKWTVTATVDDTQVGLIGRGDQAQMTTDNVSSTFFGTVSSVSMLASSSDSSASYPVDIAVTGSPSGLHDGASATVAIIYKQLANVLTVPAMAIHSDGSAKYVYVNDNGAKTKHAVTTGLSSGGTTQIKTGLRSGEQVYVDTIALPTSRSSNSTTGRGAGFGGGGFGGGFPGGGGGFPGGGGGGFPGGVPPGGAGGGN